MLLSYLCFMKWCQIVKRAFHPGLCTNISAPSLLPPYVYSPMYCVDAPPPPPFPPFSFSLCCSPPAPSSLPPSFPLPYLPSSFRPLSLLLPPPYFLTFLSYLPSSFPLPLSPSLISLFLPPLSLLLPPFSSSLFSPLFLLIIILPPRIQRCTCMLYWMFTTNIVQWCSPRSVGTPASYSLWTRLASY